MTDEAAAPAGWYDDGTGRQRWFDGTAWGQYAEETGTVAPAEQMDDEPVIIRRTRRTPFNPPPAEPAPEFAGITVSRNWGLGLRSANSKKECGLTRNRKVAGDLPAWAPLPPGELLVDRSAGRRT